MALIKSLRLLLPLALLGTVTARAQSTSYDLERLSLDPSARGSLVLGSGETLPAGGFRFAVGAGWERAPLVLLDDGRLRGRGLFATGGRRGDVVTDRWMLHGVAAVGILDRLELGVRVPYVVSQNGSDLTAEGLPKLRKDTLGTLSAMLRLGLSRQADGSPVSTAVAFVAALPQHRGSDLDGDPKVFFVPRLELGRRFDGFLVAGNLGAIIRSRALDLTVGEKLRHELTAGLVAATTGAPLRLEASLRGAFNMDGLGAHGELLGGARLGVARWLELFALAGPGFGESPGTPTFRALVGLALQTPEPIAKAAEPPPPPPPAPAPAPAPEPAPPPPPPPPPDPCAAGQAHTPEQCPDLDDDGDGIPNRLDKCPLVPGVAEYEGCPPPPRAEIKAGKIDIKEKVFFDTGTATLQPRSHALLDDVAKLIVDNPQVGEIQIEGHTDSRGSAALNRRLSLARAEAVRAYLIARGVDAARLKAKGFGPDRPAQPNTTAAGREANRRVEFTILGIEKS